MHLSLLAEGKTLMRNADLLFSTPIHILQWGLSFGSDELVGLQFFIPAVETGNDERTLRMINQDQLLNFN